MWRSFFYAAGIALFFTGLQGLVVEHVLVPKNTKLQRLVRKILDDDNPKAPSRVAVQPVGVAGNANANSPTWSWSNQPQQQTAVPVAATQQPARNFGSNVGSRFGPSRFAGPRYGTGYGGARVNSTPQTNSPFSGFQNQTSQPNAQLAGYRPTGTTAKSAQKKPIALQKLIVREWMPWSLLASGAIIFLYTHTLHRRRNHE
jgi:hypothetical protein